MLKWSKSKFVLLWLGCTIVPVVFLFALSAWLYPSPGGLTLPPLLMLAGLLLSAAAGLLGAWVCIRGLGLSVRRLVDYCADPGPGGPAPPANPGDELSGQEQLTRAIHTMRQALLDCMNLYRAYFDSARDIYLSISPARGEILQANQAFCRKLGLLRSEVIGKNAKEFLELDGGWPAALEGRQSLHSGSLNTGAGRKKVEVNLSWERGGDDREWVLGIMLHDVTRRDSLHRELLQKSTALESALEEIKQVDALKDQFLTTLSHELKTPLVSIKGFMGLMKRGQLDPQDSANYLEICWRNLGKLENQIDNLLDLARLSQGGEQYAMGPVDLSALVRTSLENLRPLTVEKGLSISDVGPRSVMVNGNPEKLVQLVDNLLVNAIKYNHVGGNIGIKLEDGPEKVHLEVSDSGVGMERTHMAKIFNRFYRAEMPGTGRIEGLGIGLSLVQEIVKLHRGDIQVESSPGAGTAFKVELEASHG